MGNGEGRGEIQDSDIILSLIKHTGCKDFTHRLLCLGGFCVPGVRAQGLKYRLGSCVPGTNSTHNENFLIRPVPQEHLLSTYAMNFL